MRYASPSLFASLVLLLAACAALVGCNGDGAGFSNGFSIGRTSYSEMTDPTRRTVGSTPTPTDTEWRATVSAFERAANAIYERGYKDGREVNCDLFEKFNRGEISQAGGEREVRRIFNERAGTYRSQTLADEYTKGWKDGADSLAAVLFGVQSC